MARDSIYYWKCDRPAALHGVARSGEDADARLLSDLQRLLAGVFPGPLSLHPAGGRGNHHTYLMDNDGLVSFVRVEDGPEGDGHLDMESRVMAEVAKTGVPVPRVLFTDASRQRIPFAVQVIEYFDCPDLNRLHHEGLLPLAKIAEETGRAVARWQDVPVAGFGPFDPMSGVSKKQLPGYHRNYAAYFRLHLERHLGLLTTYGFLTEAEAREVRHAIEDNATLLEIGDGVLVHKDLALWNILGTPDGIRAIIDWDDAISGDPCDDLSLLACFHSSDIVQSSINGYMSARALPGNFLPRFWLHLLRNMIVKAVIRCGSGYFDQAAGGAFLMASGQDGAAFRKFTKERLLSACRGLRESRSLSDL